MTSCSIYLKNKSFSLNYYAAKKTWQVCADYPVRQKGQYQNKDFVQYTILQYMKGKYTVHGGKIYSTWRENIQYIKGKYTVHEGKIYNT